MVKNVRIFDNCSCIRAYFLFPAQKKRWSRILIAIKVKKSWIRKNDARKKAADGKRIKDIQEDVGRREIRAIEASEKPKGEGRLMCYRYLWRELN